MHEPALHGAHMEGPRNTLPMMAGEGPFGSIAMGGMFTVLKVREDLAGYDEDPGWYDNPPGTVSESAEQWGESPGAAADSDQSAPSHDPHDPPDDDGGRR